MRTIEQLLADVKAIEEQLRIERARLLLAHLKERP